MLFVHFGPIGKKIVLIVEPKHDDTINFGLEDSDPDPDPDWLRLHEDSNPDSDHL